eukprot:2421014-Pyramimonas_sp.AAC.1
MHVPIGNRPGPGCGIGPGGLLGAGSRNSTLSKKECVLKLPFFGAAADLDFPAPASSIQLESASEIRGNRVRFLRVSNMQVPVGI